MRTSTVAIAALLPFVTAAGQHGHNHGHLHKQRHEVNNARGATLGQCTVTEVVTVSAGGPSVEEEAMSTTTVSSTLTKTLTSTITVSSSIRST